MTASFDLEAVPGWFDYPEIYDQAIADAVDGDVLVEVGSWHGKSAIYLALAARKAGKSVEIVCVDPWRGTEVIELHGGGDLLPAFMANVRAADVEDLITPFRMTSLEAAAWFEQHGHRPSFVFLDGDHSLDAVRADVRAWWPLLAPGGTLAGHDYDRTETVRRAVVERFGAHVHEHAPRSWSVVKRFAPSGTVRHAGLAACINMRDEEHVIERCIEGVAPYVDALIVVDTGSKSLLALDRVVALAARLHMPLHVARREWRGYASNQCDLLDIARRAGYSHAFVLDAAEQVIGGPLDISPDADGVSVCRMLGGYEVWSPRIFRLASSWRYEGERHAYPVAGVDKPVVSYARGFDVVNLHDGASGQLTPEQQRLRYANDVVHFLKQIDRAADSPRTWYYLAQSAKDAGWTPLAAWAYRKRLGMRDGNRDERYLSALWLADHERDRGRADEAIEIDPARPEAFELLARLQLEAGKPKFVIATHAQAHAAVRPHDELAGRFLLRPSAYWQLDVHFARALIERGERMRAFEILAATYDANPVPELWQELDRARSISLGAPGDCARVST